eukprot:509525-Rhodomonas_salina.1
MMQYWRSKYFAYLCAKFDLPPLSCALCDAPSCCHCQSKREPEAPDPQAMSWVGDATAWVWIWLVFASLHPSGLVLQADGTNA